MSSAAMFVDIKQAFYRTLRPLLVQRYCTDQMLARYFQEQGWDESMFQDFLHRVRETPALAQAMVSPHQQAQTNAVLSSTWFHLRQNHQTLTQTESGARPGDSLADLLFAYVMSRFLHQLRSRFEENQLRTVFQLQWIPQAPTAPDELDAQSVIQACWVDDLVLLMRSHSASNLLDKVHLAAAIAQDLACEFGFQLNYERNKTAAILALRGPGSRQLWTTMLGNGQTPPGIHFQCRSIPAGATLEVVPDYVYLGQLQNQSGNPSIEVKRRFLMIQHVSRILRSNIFRSPKLPFRTKTQLWKALVLSKLTYGAGAWQQMHIATARTWHTQVLNQYNSLTHKVTRGPGVMNLDILATCQMVPPMLLLAKLRFILFDRIMSVDLPELLSILQAQDQHTGWLAMIRQDLYRLGQCCPTHPAFALTQHEDLQCLAHYCNTHPKALTKVGRWAQKLYCLYLQLWQQFRNFQQQWDQTWTQMGATWIQPEEATSSPDGYECDQCQLRFASFKALCSHAYQKHTDINVAQRYAGSNVCRGCMKMYQTRPQTVHHLKYMRTGCLLKLILTVPPLSDEELADILAHQQEVQQQQKKQQRKQQRRIPMCVAQGPQRPWPWQNSLSQHQQDSRHVEPPEPSELETWQEQIFIALNESQPNRVAVLLDLLDQIPYHGQLAVQLLDSFAADNNMSAPHQAEQYLDLQDAIALWQDNAGVPPHQQSRVPRHKVVISLHQVRMQPLQTTPHDLPMPLRRQLLIDQLWLETNVPWQLHKQVQKEQARQYQFPTPERPMFSRMPVFLYLFSGRRRPGDFQQHMDSLLAKHCIQGKVLLIDLALSPQHDVGQRSLINTLTAWMQSGTIVGYLAAPPCETWSEARWIPHPDPRAPRPLRDAQFPICRDALTAAELHQLSISNLLLYVAVILLIVAVKNGIPSVMEHPREPKRCDRASIWRLPWLQRLQNHALLTRHLICLAGMVWKQFTETHSPGDDAHARVFADHWPFSPAGQLEGADYAPGKRRHRSLENKCC